MKVLKYSGLSALICIPLICVFVFTPIWYFGEDFPLIANFIISFLCGVVSGSIAYTIVYLR